MLVALALGLVWMLRPVFSLKAQAPEGNGLFAVRCAGCHGADARGGDHGPPLVGARELRGKPVAWVRHLINTGIPSRGMPAFDLPAGKLDALAAFVVWLNSSAAQSAVGGDRADGKKFFFGPGQCGSCHMVAGRGFAVGPDLSNVANERTVKQLRTSLLNPNETHAPGYDLVTVHLRNGETIRGFASSRSGLETVVQDLRGRFHMLPQEEIARVHEEKQSLMPPVKASPEELQNLIAYLSSLTGVKPGTVSPASPPSPDGISWSRILHPRPGDWVTYNGNLDGNRYSELTQINAENVKHLQLKWIFPVHLWKQILPDTPYLRAKVRGLGVEATPLVADGIMYITGLHETFALDAGTGQKIWQDERSRPPTPLDGDAAIGTNRGVALLGDNVFKVTGDAHVIALNRTTGKLVWEQVMPDEPMHYGSTVAPLVVKDKVIAGVSGADEGVRGLIAAYQASDGKPVWKRWMIPDKGEPGAETWGGNPRKDGGGSTWLTGSYDPETDTLYWATATPFPDYDGSSRPGDNLYTECIMALNPDTGKLKWYYQTTPHDLHAWDATEPMVLIDTHYQGQQRKLMLHADRNGFFYVLDRTNGKVLLAKPFVRVTWASGIGADGRPKLLPKAGIVCPEWGTDWNATAFNPKTRLYYLIALDKCADVPSGTKYLEAVDIDTGNVVWKIPQFGPARGENDPGVLATAGGLVFYGDRNGNIIAADANSGKPLWSFRANGPSKASPMTYIVDGKQYVAVAVGPNILSFSLP
jgi:PQQ-dependent dehydrogenase (methanol/ethanol family)